MQHKEKVLVSGGTGYIAQQLIYDLLNLGYVVNTTVRKLEDNRCEILKEWQHKYEGRLNIFVADVMIKDSFLPALQGCKAVFHLATPVLIKNKPEDPVEMQVKPAVEGTQNILDSILKTDGITDIIVTSSVSSIFTTFEVDDRVYDEKDFNLKETVESCAYSYAKTQAELKVWEFEKLHKDKYRIVTVNPGLVFGPLIGTKVLKWEGKESNVGLDHIKDFINGKHKLIPKGGRTFVDVRDVSQAHLRAYENKDAQGRFICNVDVFDWSQFASTLKKLVPEAPIPNELNVNAKDEPALVKLDNTKSKEVLGINYISLENMIRDELKQFVDLPYPLK